MCRTVSDAVQVLDAIVGYDAFDAVATGAASKYIPHGGYTQFLKEDGLRGKRLGVLNGFFQFQGYGETILGVYNQHLTAMRKHGAVVIENLDVATDLTALLADIGSNEGIAMLAEFKLSLNAYLADLLYSPVRSLADVIAFNIAHPVQVSAQNQLNPSFFYSLLVIGQGFQKIKHYTVEFCSGQSIALNLYLLS
jgi:amidase